MILGWCVTPILHQDDFLTILLDRPRGDLFVRKPPALVGDLHGPIKPFLYKNFLSTGLLDDLIALGIMGNGEIIAHGALDLDA